MFIEGAGEANNRSLRISLRRQLPLRPVSPSVGKDTVNGIDAAFFRGTRMARYWRTQLRCSHDDEEKEDPKSQNPGKWMAACTHGKKMEWVSHHYSMFTSFSQDPCSQDLSHAIITVPATPSTA